MSNINIISNSTLFHSKINNYCGGDDNIDFDEMLIELLALKKAYVRNNDKAGQNVIQEAIVATQNKDHVSLFKTIAKFTLPIINCINKLSLNVLGGIIANELSQ